MNHSIDLSAQEIEAQHHGAQINGAVDRGTEAAQRSGGDQISWDGQDQAPATGKDLASKGGASRSRFKHQKNCGLMGRLAGKLRRMDFGKPAPQSDSQLAETQLGNDPIPAMNFHYTPGSQPLPRYTIRRGIGVGGFGEVYFAVTDAGKEVALKRIQRNLEIELRGASQCLNLKHPNLVALYDICQDDEEQSWVVMEYVAGKNLRQILDLSPSGLPIDEVHRWFTAIASGVAHLHSAGLVHRDIKPGNVFDDLGTVKVGDYGLSKFISASHRGGHTESVGTFHYMAPEIGRGRYGREIDIYALGILLYELLTGRVPFDGESSHEIIVKHLTAVPDLTGINEPYRTVIAKCLEKDPEQRYKTVPETMAALGLPLNDGSAGAAAAPVASPTPGSPAPGSPAPGSAGPAVAGAAAAPHDPKMFVTAKAVGPAPAEPAAAAPHPFAPGRWTHEPLSQEPLARAVGAGVSDLGRWWKSLDQSPGTKAMLLVAFVFFLILNSGWVVLALTFIGLFYVPYYIVRQMVLQGRQQPSYAQAQRLAAASAPAATKRPKPLNPRPLNPKPISRKQWCHQMRRSLRAKSSLHRVAELHTSWIASVMTVAGLALAAGLVGLHDYPVTARATAHYAWMGIVALLSSLSILGLGKLWERDEGECLPRRIVLAGLGAGVGAAAYGLQQYLLLPVDQVFRDVDITDLPAALYDGRVPMAGAMMAHYALLFAVLRWWKPVDPLRRRRLSIWSVAVAVVADWAIHQILPIPQPAGMMIAGGTAIAVQMSAPWINRRTDESPRVQPQDHGRTDPANPHGVGSMA